MLRCCGLAVVLAATGAGAATPLLETRANHASAYVHAEVVVTRRLLHDAPMRLFQEFPPVTDVDAAMVITHGEPVPVRLERDGAILEGFAQSHSVFPERSGTLVIPGAEVTVGTRGSRSRAERIVSPPLTVVVRPVPASFPTNSPWFPADEVRLTDTWVPEAEHAVGGPIRRELVVEATGTPGSAIPPLTARLPRSFRAYPEPASLGEQVVGGTVVGRRTELRTLIPTEPGAALVPSVEVVWWNTRTDSLATTVVPVRRLAVSGNAPEAPAPAEDSSVAPVATLDPRDPDTATPPVLVVAVALVGALGWLWALVLWRRAPRRVREAPATARPAISPGTLARRCQGRPPEEAKAAVLAWLADRWGVPPPAVARRLAGTAPGHALLDRFNDAIYARSPRQLPAIEPLLEALLDDSGPTPEAALPPLYGDGANRVDAAPEGRARRVRA